MFETTFGVLHESPFAIVPLAVIVWFVGRTARRSGILSRIARYVLVFGVVPPFGLFLLAELLSRNPIRELARTLLDGEIQLAIDTLAVVDSLIAAVLRAFLQFVAGVAPNELLGSFTSALPSWNPFAALSVAGFLFAVFVVHFVTGVFVIRLTQREDGSSAADEWLTVAGVVLFVSGMVWTLLQFDPLDFGRFELQTAVLSSSMGLISGVAASNLSVDIATWRAGGGADEVTSGSDTRATESTSRSTNATSHPEIGTSRHTTALQRLQGAVQSLFHR